MKNDYITLRSIPFVPTLGLSLALILGLLLAGVTPAEAATYQIGPGADLAGATDFDTADLERMNVVRTAAVLLPAGTYSVLDFQLNVLNADTGTGNAGTITPMLLMGTPPTYTALWVGNAFDPTATGIQTAETYTGETFTLAAETTVYAGIFTGSLGSAIPALQQVSGTTDHDNSPNPPTGPGDTVSGFSHTLTRSYAIEINVATAIPPTFIMLEGGLALLAVALLGYHILRQAGT